MLVAAGSTDWTGVAALAAAAVALTGFLITAIRGRRADDLDTLIESNAELRTDNTVLRADVKELKVRVEDLEEHLVKCQRDNGRLRRKLTAAGVA